MLKSWKYSTAHINYTVTYSQTLEEEKSKNRKKISKNLKMQVLSNKLLEIVILKNWKLFNGN